MNYLEVSLVAVTMLYVIYVLYFSSKHMPFDLVTAISYSVIFNTFLQIASLLAEIIFSDRPDDLWT